MVSFSKHYVALHMTIQSPRSGCTMGQTGKIEVLGETKLTDSMRVPYRRTLRFVVAMKYTGTKRVDIVIPSDRNNNKIVKQTIHTFPKYEKAKPLQNIFPSPSLINQKNSTYQ